ncbi:PTS sugar transporter subunit IIA [Anaerobranca gottschalkii]|uniref:PTS system D-fructose-specific IIA component (F1P-forming), Frc family (TC 4.A.2.1.4) n=1 Tax=Anaerobranca gottschalkii DSM 13577 TaxID=1120990 RepID=A0A1H9ZWN7_9FIRM|nr:fructose PTS transporter subunit IIA [Anaerobranca gottschalkii]SES86120.1 PTS system D-fructose-specific IIA component (F1P-forming), Frc family (TC 4.A.2.1.4) [Anaerobranca gottschalkii DSM 13577]
MELNKLLKENLIKMDLNSKTKDEVLEELVELLIQGGVVEDKGKFLEVLKERERITTTGIGMGIAIPHGKDSTVLTPAVAFGKSELGIDYDSLDGEPAKLFFLIAVPEGGNNEHLAILSKLSRKLIHEEVRMKLFAAKTYQEILKAFE